MQVVDVIKMACTFVDREDLFKYVVFGGAIANVSTDDQALIDRLVSCLNRINKEIASEYISLVYEQNISSSTNRIMLNSLTYKCLGVDWVKDSLGNSVNYELMPDYIKVASGEYTVRYFYSPNAEVISGEICDYYGKMEESVLAYGVAMEYFYWALRLEEGAIWEKRYKDALYACMRKKTSSKLPKRGWF